MLKQIHPMKWIGYFHCRFFRHEKINRLLHAVLLILLFHSPSFSQVAKMAQAGVIEAGFGMTPNLTGASSVAVSGNYAYIVGVGDVLQVLDITLPGFAIPKGSLANGAGGTVLQRPQHILVQGNYAYITSNAANALEIIDISNPALPVHKTVIYDGEGGAPYLNGVWGLAISGNYLYATFDGGLEILDISNPALPVHKGSIHDGGGSAPYLKQAVSVFIVGNLAYVGTLGALEIIDISNPALPVHKGALLDGGGPVPFLAASYSLFVSGNYAYVPDFTKLAIEIIDVSNPTLPVHITSMVHNASTGPYLQGAFGLTVSDNYLYVVGNFRNFEIIDITNPAAPVHKSGFVNSLLGHSREIVIVGKYAYVPSRDANVFTIIDISDPSSPTIKGNTASGTGGAVFSQAHAAAVDGNYAYVANTGDGPLISGFEVVDISNPSAPLHAGNILQNNNGQNIQSTNFVYSAAKSGNIILLANHEYDALVLVDVTNPLVPFQKSFISDGENGAKLDGAISVQVHPNRSWAYVASDVSNAVETVNILNPATPVHQGAVTDGNGSAPYLNKPTSMAIRFTSPKTYGYITSAGSHALEILDLSAPNAAVHSGSLLDGNGSAPFLKNPKSIFVQGNYAFIADYGSSALEIVDITNPAVPLHKGALQSTLLDSLNSVYVAGNFAYITCAAQQPATGLYENGRLVVVDIINPASPVHYQTFTTGTNGALIDYPTSVTVSGAYAYITNAGLFEAMNVVFLYGPDITGFSPSSAAVGSSVTVTGKNFNTFITASIAGIPADITNVTENTITFIVPPGATNDPIITFSYAGQHITTSTNFVVTPTTAAATEVHQNNFTANWSDVGATTYYFDLSIDNFTTFVNVYNNFTLGNSTHLAVTGLNPATTYQYRVRSSDGTLISGNSNLTTVFTTPDAPVANAASLINQADFTASWTVAAGAVNYFLDVATDVNFTNFLVGYNNLSIPATSARSQMVAGLTSFTSYYYRLRAANASGSSPYSNAISVTTLDITVPVISSPLVANATTLTTGASPALNTIITDNVNVDSAKLFYRGISQASFHHTNLQGPGGLGGNYSVTIQPGWYDSLGMEYYFLAKDKAGNKTVSGRNYIQLITPSITLPTLPSGTSQSDYRMVAFPYQLPTDNKVTTVYNNVPWNDNTKAGLWWWNSNLKNGAGNYDQYGVSTTLLTIDPGKGYWAITSSPVTPTLSNLAAPKYNRSNLYSMTLKPGWNQIGNPYPVAISWDDVTTFNQQNNVTAISGLTVYDGSGYKSATGNVLLKAFEGGFVKNLSSGDITIQIPFKGQTTKGGRIATVGSDISQDDWNIFLYINQNDRTNQLGGFGMHLLAQSGPDRFDNFNPPGFLDIPEVNFINADYPDAAFSKDMVKSQDAYTWTFTSGGTIGKLTQLLWGTPIITSSKQLLLLDEEQLKVIDMSRITTYEFVLTSNSRFRIFYGSDVNVTTTRIVANAPYPNPLSNDGRATINLSLPESSSDYSVNLQIYNVQGSAINSLNERLSSGIHPLAFTLPESLREGIYIYKLAITNAKTSSIYTGKIIKP